MRRDILGALAWGVGVWLTGCGASTPSVGVDSALARSCDAGDALSCQRLGMHRLNGEGMAKDLVEANARLDQACELGRAPACTELGFSYEVGRGAKPDVARAAVLYNKACEAGDLRWGCHNSGVLLAEGRGVKADPALAASRLGASCDAGLWRACSNLVARFVKPEDMARDPGLWHRRAATACERGSPDACNRLGIMTANGAGVSSDQAQAAALFEKACNGGSGHGCNNLAKRHVSGRGVPKNEVRALELLHKACEQKSPAGCRSLGLRHRDGEGVAMNPRRAAELLKKSCDLSNEEACSERLMVCMSTRSAYCLPGATPEPMTTDAEGEARVFLGTGITEDSTDGARWSAYATLVSATRSALKEKGVAADWLVVGDLVARELLVTSAEFGEPPQSRYLRETLPKIIAAGFLREHVLLDFDGDAGGEMRALTPKQVYRYMEWLVKERIVVGAETGAGLSINGRVFIRRPARASFPVIALGAIMRAHLQCEGGGAANIKRDRAQEDKAGYVTDYYNAECPGGATMAFELRADRPLPGPAPGFRMAR
jgi:uncharacterized protein